ncbi:MAG: hypothetical protein BWY31_04742 [Lentisphaerae bacterium ADurb.Bin242]|nr:MAG: hypothetical protein BWY31_04742 [Lentisphaerae bacterium ADurb.Bin242]
MLKNTVSEPVPRNITRFPRGGKRGWRPKPPGFFVANIKGLSRSVRNRIVFPRSQPELMGILAPGIGVSAFRDHGTKIRIREHIDPRRWRPLLARRRDDIFPSVPGKSSQAVKENQIRPLSNFRVILAGIFPAGWDKRKRVHFRLCHVFQLFRQSSASIRNNNPRHCLDKNPVFFRYLVGPPQKNTSLPACFSLGRGRNQTADPFAERITINGTVLIPDHKIHNQSLQPPVGVGLDHLHHKIDIVLVLNPYEDNREIPRDAVTPKIRLAPHVPSQNTRARPP